MARPGTWKREQLLKIHAEIKESGSTIKDYCAKQNIGYHKLYQALRRQSIVGEYAATAKATVNVPKTVETATSAKTPTV